MLIALLTLALASAEPPKLECLSDVSIEGLWQGPKRPYFHNDDWLVGPLIVLVGRHDDPDPDATWGVWNEPEIKAYIDQEQISVIFLQDEGPGFESIADRVPQSNGDGDRVHLRGASGEDRSGDWNLFLWPTSSPSPDEVLEWIGEPEQKQRERNEQFRALLEGVERNPSDIKLRYEAIELCESIGGYPAMAHRFVPWLLLNHDKWYEYENAVVAGALSEDRFRAAVFSRIRSAREDLGLFGHEAQFSRNLNVPKRLLVIRFDSWIDRVERERTGFWSGIVGPEKGMEWQWSRTFKPYAEAIKAGEATDRDRFILDALTAEGDEWQQLVDRYAQPDDPRPSPSQHRNAVERVSFQDLSPQPLVPARLSGTLAAKER